MASLAAGWLTAAIVRARPPDRFTLILEFATRNVSVATAMAVTVLGDTAFALFAAAYFLTELPLALVAVAVYRRRSERPAPVRPASHRAGWA